MKIRRASPARRRPATGTEAKGWSLGLKSLTLLLALLSLVWMLPSVGAGDVASAEAQGELGLGVDPSTERATEAPAAQPVRQANLLWEAGVVYAAAYGALALYVAALRRAAQDPSPAEGRDS